MLHRGVSPRFLSIKVDELFIVANLWPSPDGILSVGVWLPSPLEGFTASYQGGLGGLHSANWSYSGESLAHTIVSNIVSSIVFRCLIIVRDRPEN